jgi:RimJ/RimL family protein N-acetyltransferase
MYKMIGKMSRTQKTYKTRYRQTRKSRQTKLSNKTKKYIPPHHKQQQEKEKLQLISLSDLDNQQITALARITQNADTMKWIGKGVIWSTADIRTFIADEKKEKTKLANAHYYTFVLLKDHTPIGFISGRKHNSIITNPKRDRFNLLLRMFIDPTLTGQGYGTLILKLFIDKYSHLIKNIKNKTSARNLALFSDISPDNIASIKIHEKNGFKYLKDFKYGKDNVTKRYIKIISL